MEIVSNMYLGGSFVFRTRTHSVVKRRLRLGLLLQSGGPEDLDPIQERTSSSPTVKRQVGDSSFVRFDYRDEERSVAEEGLCPGLNLSSQTSPPFFIKKEDEWNPNDRPRGYGFLSNCSLFFILQ